MALVKLERKPFRLCFSTFNISSDITFSITYDRHNSKMFKIFRKPRVKKNLASQTNQQTIHNDVANSNTKQ